MKARVLRKFRDKYTGTVYIPGGVLDVTEERMTEMNGGFYGKLVEPIPIDPPPDNEPPPDGELKPNNEPNMSDDADNQEAESDAPPKTTKKQAKRGGE